MCLWMLKFSVTQNKHMLPIKYDFTSPILTTRLERPLRERELRECNGCYNPNEDAIGNKESDLFLSEGDSWGFTSDEEFLEVIAAARSFSQSSENQDGIPVKQRLLVVANKLPVSAVRKGADSWQLEMSVGGLVTAVLGVKGFETRWIGWPGVNVSDEVGRRALTKKLSEKRCIPVFLNEDIVHQYYNGYCNNILWPHLHYLGLQPEDRLANTRCFESQFDAYIKANEMFAAVVNEHYGEGDVVWCHDYHLMFLPKCLKMYNKNMKVGWFLHTPFPSSEIYRTLPSRSELLRSILAADLVGFHTYDYVRHFVSACTRVLGLEGTPEGVEDHGKFTHVAAFPIGIDSNRFIRALELPQVRSHIKELQERFSGRKVMLGVDRLDMIKGIPQKILAFEKFLEENPDWHNKVVLLQIAVPTRTDVPEYQKLTSQVHEIVGRINGRFGTLTAVPIHHLDRSLDFHALCALYAVTDIALVTSLRDGMNLVSYEYVACQSSKKGVLILSEFAGAAQSLGAGAILVNPWNITEMAASIAYALNMPADEREKRHQHNFTHVTTHTAQEWAETFVSELNHTIAESQSTTKQVPPLFPVRTAIENYLKSNNRLIILGFNATLTDSGDYLGRKSDQIKEMEFRLHPDLKQPLEKLCNDLKTTVMVISGSDRSILDNNFRRYNIWLAAENGMFLRCTKEDWVTTIPEISNMEWVDSVKHVFEYFTERTPRSHFEVRQASLVWNYKFADIEFGRIQARDLLQHLWTGPISNANVDVVQGGRSVEVRAAGLTKGAAIERILGNIVHYKRMKTPIDYVLCIGHFLGKDEDIYKFFDPELPPEPTIMARAEVMRPVKVAVSKFAASKSGEEAYFTKGLRPSATSVWQPTSYNDSSPQDGSSVLDLSSENYFSCAVSRTQSAARYRLGSADNVVSFLKELAWCS
ncbi:Glycosyl transferase, family 20 [Dillenia turbinata]|uniref:alpha,alpha-trehalose-phosphate synthase (UDP-forming) n=1 Tax=Dillenia turbinata TaxID=194707 RepID=A0AAN8UN91_9MAGN